MLYRFLVLVWFFIISGQAFGSAPSSAPLFSNLTKTYDLHNPQNLALRQKTQGQIKDAKIEAVITPTEDFWQPLQPKLNDSLKQKIVNYQKNIDHDNNFNKTGSLNEEKYTSQLNSIKNDFLQYYLDKQVVNGFIIGKIKQSNPGIDSLEKSVQNIGDFSNKPQAKAQPLSAHANPSMEESALPEPEEWKVDVGSKIDFLRQKGRTWFNCPLFNSEANIEAGGFSHFNYNVKVYKELSVLEDTTSPFSIVKTSVEVNPQDSYGAVNTNLTEKLNVSYTSFFTRKDNSIRFNYQTSF